MMPCCKLTTTGWALKDRYIAARQNPCLITHQYRRYLVKNQHLKALKEA